MQQAKTSRSQHPSLRERLVVLHNRVEDHLERHKSIQHLCENVLAQVNGVEDGLLEAGFQAYKRAAATLAESVRQIQKWESPQES